MVMSIDNIIMALGIFILETLEFIFTRKLSKEAEFSDDKNKDYMMMK